MRISGTEKSNDCKYKLKRDNPSPIEMAFNPALSHFAKQLQVQQRQISKEKYQRMNLTHSYQSMFGILWYTQLPCFDVKEITSDKDQEHGMLKACYWKGKKVPCSKIFKMTPTDTGIEVLLQAV